MSKTLDLDVYDSRNRLLPFLKRNEEKIERGVIDEEGETINLRIRAPQIRQKAWAKRGGLVIVHLEDRESPFSQVVKAAEVGTIRSAMVVTTPGVFNDPEFQSRCARVHPLGRLRIFIEGEETNHSEELLQGIKKWLKSIAEEDPRAEERAHPPYLRVSRCIRNEVSGRLDAKKVAQFFGLKPAELARVVGVSRQALSKTPDSAGIQKALYPFEEITRGMLMVGDDPTLFRQWLNTPSRDLPKKDGQHMTPMEMIREGHPAVIAGLVDSALTGHPS
ncbi:MAG: hypothetical protein JNJ70_13100 [Verrucomicrobiales bacterium]|nr:hypothetical protein [Verrucomicrobiales bacterium]